MIKYHNGDKGECSTYICSCIRINYQLYAVGRTGCTLLGVQVVRCWAYKLYAAGRTVGMLVQTAVKAAVNEISHTVLWFNFMGRVYSNICSIILFN